jgi:hypothetical protein
LHYSFTFHGAEFFAQLTKGIAMLDFQFARNLFDGIERRWMRGKQRQCSLSQVRNMVTLNGCYQNENR